MKHRYLFVASILILLYAETMPAADTKEDGKSSSGKGRIALVNLNDAVSETAMKHLEAYAERELRIRSDVIEKDLGKDLTLADCANIIGQEDELKEKYPIIVAFYSSESDDEHVYTNDSKSITVINTIPLKTDNSKRFVQRLERLMMRGAGKAAGLGFDPDPHCVMHSYKSVEDLDRMGRNFSPPWQAMFMKAAKRMKLEIIPYSPQQTTEQP